MVQEESDLIKLDLELDSRLNALNTFSKTKGACPSDNISSSSQENPLNVAEKKFLRTKEGKSLMKVKNKDNNHCIPKIEVNKILSPSSLLTNDELVHNVCDLEAKEDENIAYEVKLNDKSSQIDNLLQKNGNENNFKSDDTSELQEVSNISNEDTIFEEFLENSTRMKIQMLTMKLKATTETLKALKTQNCKLTSEVNEKHKLLTSNKREIQRLSKQNLNFVSLIKKKDQTNKNLQSELDVMSNKYHNIMKELDHIKNLSMKDNGKKNSLEVRLSSSEEKIKDMKEKFDKKENYYRGELYKIKTNLDAKDLQLQMLYHEKLQQELLLKKQEKLLNVVEEQKKNLLTAKVTKCLQEKFLLLLSDMKIEK